jgi:hypothetical protein
MNERIEQLLLVPQTREFLKPAGLVTARGGVSHRMAQRFVSLIGRARSTPQLRHSRNTTSPGWSLRATMTGYALKLMRICAMHFHKLLTVREPRRVSQRSVSRAVSATRWQLERSAGRLTDASPERPRPTQRARTLSACGPFGPCVVSNSTRWPSSRER